jgi:hypothetical protein
MTIFAFHFTKLFLHFCTVKENLFIHHLMSKYLYTLVLLLTAHLLTGQGWERIYSGGGFDEAQEVAITPDGGYIMAGVYSSSNLQLIKVDVDGFLQWSKFTLVGAQTKASSIKVLPDSSYLVVGTRWTGNGAPSDPSSDGFLFKTDFSGNVLWTKTLGLANKADDINDLVVLADGSLVMTGTDNSADQMRILKTDAQGNLLWSKTFGLASTFLERGYSLTVASNGDIVAVGERRKNPSIQDIYIVRVAAIDGALIWETSYDNGLNLAESGNSIVAAPGGGFVIGGYTQVPTTSYQAGLVVKIDENPVANPAPIWVLTFANTLDSIRAQIISDVNYDGTGGYIICGRTPEAALVRSEIFMARVAADGALVWENGAGKVGLSEGFGVSPTSDGSGFVAVGYTYTNSDPFSPQKYTYMLRSDFEGKFFTNYLSGRLYNDQNNDCTYQAGEPGLNKWLLRVSSPDFTRYVTTNAQGNYFIMVDTGVYDIKVFPTNAYWGSCLSSVTVPVSNFYDTIFTDISVKKITFCPYNEVDIQTPILRRCVDNTYTVRYCNSGTVPSQNTIVYVEKSPGFAITSSSLPFTTAGDTLIFSVGTVNPGDCGSFTINAFLDCNAELSSAHCMRAHITPDSFCSANNWNGSLIEARAKCENDTVKLSLINKGFGPANELEYVIIDDLVVLFVPPVGYTGTIPNLDPSEETVVFSRPANGHTYRLISEQASTYPGISIPTAAIEGCQTDTTSTVSTGFYTMFPEDDAEPFVASDCQEAYEANFNPAFLKRGHPKGYKDPHYIYPNTDVDYLIRFLNTGSDTISEVTIRDTLSAWLDPATVRPGTASHPYTYSLYGDGIVSFHLTNINLLPAGSSSSEGFVKFRVSQKPEVPCETEVLNHAAIYFDFNAPVETNETYHTVCDSFTELEVVDTTNGTRIVDFSGAGLRIYPNPFVTSTTMEITGVTASSYQIELYDAQGRLIFNQTQADSTFRLFKHQISSGFMIYRLVADGRPVASGKIMVR